MDSNERNLKPLKIIVETWNVKTDEKEKEKIIDHNNSEDRTWLGKHCFWAFRNGRGIVTRPILE